MDNYRISQKPWQFTGMQDLCSPNGNGRLRDHAKIGPRIHHHWEIGHCKGLEINIC